jgi:hypothetical protein
LHCKDGWGDQRPKSKDAIKATCSYCGIISSFSEIKWKYDVQLEVRVEWCCRMSNDSLSTQDIACSVSFVDNTTQQDGNATLSVLVAGQNGDLFFRNVPATDLYANAASVQLLAEMRDRLLSSGQVARFALTSFVPKFHPERTFHCYGVVLL